VIVESLTNLDRLTEHFTFIGFPLGITGRDGSPIRAVALVER
jgi:kynurenine formamidase